MTAEDRIAQLEAEKKALEARLAARNNQALRLKVSDKGGISVYGLNARFPMTLYRDQWLRLFDFAPEVKEFIKENEHLLSSKADKAA
jgi:ABC-type enterochelin transport system substrate-binding protein